MKQQLHTTTYCNWTASFLLQINYNWNQFLCSFLMHNSPHLLEIGTFATGVSRIIFCREGALTCENVGGGGLSDWNVPKRTKMAWVYTFFEFAGKLQAFSPHSFPLSHWLLIFYYGIYTKGDCQFKQNYNYGIATKLDCIYCKLSPIKTNSLSFMMRY